MIKKYFWFISIFTLVAACNSNPDATSDWVITSNPFFGMEPTGTPQLLAPELLASAEQEYNGTFSPDGKTLYYTYDTPEKAFITFTEIQEDNTWSKPKVASFSGEFSDFDPLFAPDGQRLYFSSSRPLPDNQKSKIWYVEKIDGAWGEAQTVVLTGTERNEYHSSVTKNGTIYFNIWSTKNILKAEKIDDKYVVEELPDIINADFDCGDPFISPDEDYLIFRGYHDDNYGKGDLYISFNINNEWTKPENLGEPINSEANEMCPYVTVDDKFFIFASSRVITKSEAAPAEKPAYDNGKENIYYLSADFIYDLKKKHLEAHK